MKYTNPQLREMCRAQKIYNDYEFSNGQPYISYVPGEKGRSSHYPYWAVSKRGVKLSDHWRNNGNYHISVSHKADKEPKLTEAKAFVSQYFHITEFARGPFGAYYSKDFVEKRIGEIIAKHEANNAH